MQRKRDRTQMTVEDFVGPIGGKLSAENRWVKNARPMVQGKAGNEVEFGQKISLSVVDGFTFIEEQGWNNFVEGVTLIASAERFRERHGVYPEAILADKTYRNSDNVAFCKKNGIRLSGPRLGRP